jgi:hypothetical protein
VVSAETIAQASEKSSGKRNIIPFSSAKAKRQSEADRLEELRELRRRLLRLIVSYETDRKNAAR